MSEDLEKLLLNINEAYNISEQAQKSVLKDTMREEITEFAKKSLLENKVNIKESVVDESGNVVEDDDFQGDATPEDSIENDINGVDDIGSIDAVSDTEIPDDTLGDDLGDTSEPDFATGEEMPSMDDMSDMDDMGVGDEFDEEVLDLRDASFDEVMQALEHLPDDTVIQIHKNPSTFNVTNMNEEICEECDDESMTEENEKLLDEMIDEMVKEEEQKSSSKILKEYARVVKAYESKLKKMGRELNESKAEVKTLKENEQKYQKVLVESKNALNKLMLSSTNLMHIANIFTENAIPRESKINILKQFDKVATINESKILFEALKNNNQKSEKQGTQMAQKLKTHLQEEKTTKKEEKVVLKEEKTFLDPDFVKFNKLSNYKI